MRVSALRYYISVQYPGAHTARVTEAAFRTELDAFSYAEKRVAHGFTAYATDDLDGTITRVSKEGRKMYRGTSGLPLFGKD
jgi:hypothetical protein